MRKLYSSLFFIFILSAISVAQSLTGTITDTSGAFIPEAQVEIKNRLNDTSLKTQTSENGSFRFTGLPNGKYIIKVSATGFSDETRVIRVADGFKETVDFVLSVGNVSAEVTVTATKTQVAALDSTVPVSIVTREEIDSQNANSIGDVLRNVPGLTTVNEGAFQVRPRIRGLESNRILVLVDGERLNNARTSTAQSGIEIGLVDISQVETVEVVRGSGSVLYGTDALAGTINIISKEAGRNEDGEFQWGAAFSGLYSTNENGRRGNVSINGSNERFAFRLSHAMDRFENYFSGNTEGLGFTTLDGFPTPGEVGNSQSHSSNTRLSSRFFINDNNDLKLTYVRRRAADIGSPLLTEAFGFNGYFPFSNRDKFSARFETRDLTNSLAKLSIGGYFQNQERKFSNRLLVPAAPPFFPGLDNFSETTTDTNSVGFDVQSNWILNKKNVLTAGVSFFRDENKDRRFQENRIPFLTRETDPSVPNGEYGSLAGFVQNEFTVTNRLRFVGGIRIERFFTNSTQTANFALPVTLSQNDREDLGIDGLESGLNVSETAVTGDIGAIFKVTDEVSLTGRAGRSFRVANLFERFFTGAGSITGFLVGNPTLEPESGINFDTALRFQTNRFAGSVTYFNNRYRDFLSNQEAINRGGNPILLPNANPMGAPIEVFQTINIGRTRIQGVEAEFEAPFQVFGGFVSPRGSVSYLRGDDLQTDQPLASITPLKTVMSLRWDDVKRNYYANWTTRIVNGQDRLPTNTVAVNAITIGTKEAGFAVSEVGGGYTITKENYKFRFNVGIKNIFDRFYTEQFVFAPARGRSFVIGSTIEFNSK